MLAAHPGRGGTTRTSGRAVPNRELYLLSYTPGRWVSAGLELAPADTAAGNTGGPSRSLWQCAGHVQSLGTRIATRHVVYSPPVNRWAITSSRMFSMVLTASS